MVKRVVFDIDRLDLETLQRAMAEIFHHYGTIDSVFEELRRKGYEFYILPLPVPEDPNGLKLLKGFPLRPLKADIPVEVLKILVKYCKPLTGTFVPDEVYIFEGLRVMVGMKLDEVFVLETSVDDVSGEVLGYALRKIEEKVLDIFVYQGWGKKCRPSLTIRAIVRGERVGEVARMMMEETGSLGVRVERVERFVWRRDVFEKDVEVFGKVYRIRFKKGVRIKPEYEDLRRIAEELQVPLIRVYEEVMRKV